jgi:ABC-2 type transport system ATP-binding protein
MLELSEQSAWTIFISSHDIDEVERLADWVGVINQGHLHLSEPTDSLQARFRRVELALPVPLSRLPAALSPEWLMPELAGQNVRLIESQYREGATEAELGRVFPGATLLLLAPMSLREIFLALAATFRLSLQPRA